MALNVYMSQLTQTQIEELANQSGYPCISIYMPAEKAGAETRKNPIIFKNLLREAQDRLEEADKHGAMSEAMTEAESYIENHDFWQHQDNGLAFFISDAGVKYHRLDCDFEKSVTVSSSFYLLPLLPILNSNVKFYLLALSQNEVKFFIGNQNSLTQTELPEGVPASLAEALKYDDPEKQTQYHSGDPSNSPVYHGQGVGTEDSKDEIRRFFHQIDNAIQTTFNKERTPLILAGVEYETVMYRELSSHNTLLEEGFIGNPENVPTQDLHQRAWEIMQSHLEQDKKAELERYQELANTTNETSAVMTEIIPAAASGQIDTLFIGADSQQWGSFSLMDNLVEIHETPQKDSVDLYDFAAVKTYLQAGKVYVLDSDEMPADTSMMAIMRYPVYVEAEKAIA